MNGATPEIPKFFEGIDLPEEYFQPLSSPCFDRKVYLDFRKMSSYAKAEGKRLNDLTREEVMLFSTKETFEETFPWLYDLTRKKEKKPVQLVV
jgi:hypothetical protein